MNDHDFLGDVFDALEVDLLLNGTEPNGASDSHRAQSDHGPPSWVSDEMRNGTVPEAPATTDHEPDQKKIVIDQRGGIREGFDTLNDAVRDGWHVVQISLKNPNGTTPFVSETGHRFEVTLEKRGPQSLFDFAASV